MDQLTLQELVAADDSLLATRTQLGDLDAYEVLVQRYQTPLICFLKFYCKSNQDIEDVVQEAFLKCFLHIDQFDVNRKFKNWLYTIARRSLPRTRVGVPESLLEPERVEGREPSPSANALRTEEVDSLWAQIRQLTSDEEFQLIWFRYIDRMRIEEIAAILGQSPDACKMKLFRLRRRLRSRLGPYLIEANRKFFQNNQAARA